MEGVRIWNETLKLTDDITLVPSFVSHIVHL